MSFVLDCTQSAWVDDLPDMTYIQYILARPNTVQRSYLTEPGIHSASNVT